MAIPQFKLLLFYISYLYFGGMVFYLVETKQEKYMHLQKLKERTELYNLMETYLAPDKPELREEILKNASQYCGLPMTTPSSRDREYVTWTFYHCVFFALTIITTVGYGNINPQTNFGRIFVIFYALLGLPMNGIMFSQFGQLYWKSFEHIHDRFKVYSHKIKLMLVIKWTIFLFPGFLFFVLLPGLVFTYFEQWTYGISVYYAFVTLTTIGFGDYAATFEINSEREIDEWYYVYQAFVLAWYIMGLGYVIMITQYLIAHYGKSNFNQLDFEKEISVKEELFKIGRGMTEDFKSVGRCIYRGCTCNHCSCCRSKRVEGKVQRSQSLPPPLMEIILPSPSTEENPSTPSKEIIPTVPSTEIIPLAPMTKAIPPPPLTKKN